MTEFNRMTIVAASKIIAEKYNKNALVQLFMQWGVEYRCDSDAKAAHTNAVSKIAIDEDIEVITVSGEMPLSRAMIDCAISDYDSEYSCHDPNWKKLIAGLKFDGFEILKKSEEEGFKLARMLPKDIPELNFREAENEVVRLLDSHGFTTAKGHLDQAISAFSRGEWSSVNGQLRNFYESYLNEIADALGCPDTYGSREKRDFLGKLNPPFLLEKYNEWNENMQKPQYVQGLLSRMHGHGAHPGLSEEEDATFRLQISLITARLFLRRYENRKKA